MKVFVLCDLEGAAGVVDFETQSYSTGRYNDQARHLATLEVNALIDGALEGGATEVVVLDGHGSGGISIEHVHPEARVIFGRPITAPWGLDDGGYGAVLLYGHHAMAGTPGGVLCHSWSSRTIASCRLNGDPIGEIGFNIALAGEFDIPTVFISGDRAAAEEARRYVPETEAVIVKEGLSRTSAVTLAPAKARDLIRTGAERAVRRRAEVPPYKVPPPYTFVTEYLDAASAESRESQPGAERTDTHTIVITGNSLVEIARNR
jgi:D-amino peptidase